MTDDLVTFLRARLDDEERTAQATLWEGSGNRPDWELVMFAAAEIGGDEIYVEDRTIANHLVTWDPARVLAEVDAKREIVKQADLYLCDSGAGCGYRTKHGHNVLRLLALAYADHPDYRDEWQPS